MFFSHAARVYVVLRWWWWQISTASFSHSLSNLSVLVAWTIWVILCVLKMWTKYQQNMHVIFSYLLWLWRARSEHKTHKNFSLSKARKPHIYGLAEARKICWWECAWLWSDQIVLHFQASNWSKRVFFSTLKVYCILLLGTWKVCKYLDTTKLDLFVISEVSSCTLTACGTCNPSPASREGQFD